MHGIVGASTIRVYSTHLCRGLYGSFWGGASGNCTDQKQWFENRHSERHSLFQRKDLYWHSQAPTEAFYLSGGSLTTGTIT